MRAFLEQLLFNCTDERSIGTSTSWSNGFQVIHLNDEANLIPNLCMTFAMQAHALGGLNVEGCFFGKPNLKKGQEKAHIDTKKKRNTLGPIVKGPLHVDKNTSC